MTDDMITLRGATMIVEREPRDGAQIRTHGVLGKAANGHVVDHLFAQR